MADKVLDGVYESDIKEQTHIINRAKWRIKSLKSDIVHRSIEDAEAELSSAVGTLPTLKRAIQGTLKDRQNAYDDAAKLAGETAAKKGAPRQEANRLRTAIAAIPRIQKVLSRIDGVLRAAKVPIYDSQAGLAYAVAKKDRQGFRHKKFPIRHWNDKNLQHRLSEQTRSLAEATPRCANYYVFAKRKGYMITGFWWQCSGTTPYERGT